MDRSVVVKPRNAALDQFRFLAFVGVLFIHLAALRGGQDALQSIYDVFSFVGRFAVPFFFVAAGYFLKYEPGREAQTIVGVARRLLIPFVVWEAFYFAAAAHSDSARLAEQMNQPGYWWDVVVNGGPGYHLWFMTSLFLCLATVTALRRFLSVPGVLAVSALFFAVGLVCGPYATLLFGPDNGVHFLTRNGPFFGLLFAAIGACGKEWLNRLSMRTALVMTIGGAALLVGECWWIQRVTYYPMIEQDFVVGTLPFAVGLVAVALRFPWASEALAKAGRVSLGCYAVHLYFVQIFLPLMPLTAAGGIAAALLSAAASVAVAFGLSKIKLTKTLVS